jgi:nucleotide-binding universal stress UspA family protein
MPREFKTVLAPTDFSEPSRVAMDYAFDVVAPGGTVIVCHVIDDVPLTYGYVGVAVPPPELGRKLTEEAARELARFVPAKAPEGVKVVQKVLHGSPYLSIVKLAAEEKVDVIVMGTHGRTGLKHMLIGSVTEKVVRKSPCPILVIHPEESE